MPDGQGAAAPNPVGIASAAKPGAAGRDQDPWRSGRRAGGCRAPSGSAPSVAIVAGALGSESSSACSSSWWWRPCSSARRLWHSFGPQNDYAGSGKKDLVIQVHAGDSTTAIGETLHNHDVVRTVKAFVEAADGNDAISSIQPGYYRLRTEIPASSAVKRLADPESRVGKLVIPEGQQLDDTTDVKTNATTPGIFTMISKATCVDLDGDKHCVSAADLRTAAEKTRSLRFRCQPGRSSRPPGWATITAGSKD